MRVAFFEYEGSWFTPVGAHYDTWRAVFGDSTDVVDKALRWNNRALRTP